VLLDVIPPTSLATDMERYQFLSRAIELLRQRTGNEGAKLPADRNERQFGAWKNYRDNALRPTNRRLHHQRNTYKARLIEADPTLRASDIGDDIDPFVAIRVAAGADTGFDSDIDLSTLPAFDLAEEQWVDPLEDYTGYTEVDGGSDITVGANLLTVSSMSRSVDSWVVSDKDAGHFSGDFTHLLRTQSQSASSAGGRAGVWAIANAVEEIITLLGADAQVVRWQNRTSLRVIEANGGSTINDSSTSLSLDTNYYLTVDRDESEGTYGELTVEIDDSSDRASPVDTLSVTLTEKQDFRYIYGLASVNTGGSQAWTGLVADLDLQEVAIASSALAGAFGGALKGPLG
jgi:hypothetical protein